MTRVYFAHSKKTYNTTTEESELNFLRQQYDSVICPNNDLPNLDQMKYYLLLVDWADIVVVSSYMDHIGKGVFAEIRRALSMKKPVYQLKELKGCFVLRKITGLEVVDINDWQVKYAKLITD